MKFYTFGFIHELTKLHVKHAMSCYVLCVPFPKGPVCLRTIFASMPCVLYVLFFIFDLRIERCDDFNWY